MIPTIPPTLETLRAEAPAWEWSRRMDDGGDVYFLGLPVDVEPLYLAKRAVVLSEVTSVIDGDREWFVSLNGAPPRVMLDWRP